MSELGAGAAPALEPAPNAPQAAVPTVEPRNVNGVRIGGVRQWYMVLSLTILSLVATLDRSSIQLLLDPIKHDLKLSDTAIGFLIGSSYGVFHLIVTFPMGWMVDRFNRKWLLAVSGLAWSACTLFTGMAHSFWQLFGGRAGVGFADGGVAPAAFSLIRDGVSKERQGRAFGIFTAGLFVGGGLSFALAGAILKLATDYGPIVLPVLGEIRPWQVVFFAVALGGLPFIGLMLGVTEPARTAAGVADRGDYLTALRYMVVNWRIYLPLMAFNTLLGLTTGGFGFWAPTLAHRNWDIPLHVVGPIMGLLGGSCPTIGLLTFGAAVDFLTRRGVRRGPGYVIVAGVILIGIPAVITPLMPTAGGFWISYACYMLVAASLAPAIQVINMRLTPSQTAGKIAVLFGLPQALVSLGASSVLVGLLSDRVFSGPHALAHAMSAMAVTFLPFTFLLALWLLYQLKYLVPIDERMPAAA